ncbi:MAG: replication-associated protein [Cressdnaviricota sp.]|nr:MAG: replication-associated protein [Cressdnaviricota sp.]
MVAYTKKNSQVVNISFRYSLPKDWKLEDGNETTNVGNRLEKYLKENISVKSYQFQLESTRKEDDPKGANYHFQGLMKLKEKDRVTALIKKINITEWRGMELSPAHSTATLEMYTNKSESKVGDEYIWNNILKEATYKGEDLPKELLLWQAMLEQYIKGPVCDRRIVWIWDPEGCGGKSKFCKYMDFKYGTKTIGYSDSKDAMYMVSKSPGAKAYFFDLTRTKPKMFSQGDLYASIEQIKNGHFMNSKYESSVVLMEPPHVVVFSNHMPEIDNLSKDRWSIYELFNGVPKKLSGKTVLFSKGFHHLQRVPDAKDIVEDEDDPDTVALLKKVDIDIFLKNRKSRVDVDEQRYTFVSCKRKSTVDEWESAIDTVQRNVRRRFS